MHKIAKRQALKFIFTLVLLIWYFGYLTGERGLPIALHSIILTWTLFILCTPTTNGGIIIDIPFHMITGKRMLYSEIAVWGFAIIYNVISYFLYPRIYFKNPMTELLYQIIAHPWPYWLIIALSSIGTFYTLIVSDDDRCIVQPIHRYISKAFKIASFFITFFMLFRELVIIGNIHGNP